MGFLRTNTADFSPSRNEFQTHRRTKNIPENLTPVFIKTEWKQVDPESLECTFKIRCVPINESKSSGLRVVFGEECVSHLIELIYQAASNFIDLFNLNFSASNNCCYSDRISSLTGVVLMASSGRSIKPPGGETSHNLFTWDDSGEPEKIRSGRSSVRSSVLNICFDS